MDEYLGIIKLFAGNFAPKGWAFCDGTLLPISQNTAMFSILGTMYGGDGITTFALPNLAKTKPKKGALLNHIICMEGIFPSRN